MAIEFETTEFEMAHGHSPRGRGQWAFAAERNAPIHEVWFAPSDSTLAEAKRAARQHFACPVGHGRIVWVCA